MERVFFLIYLYVIYLCKRGCTQRYTYNMIFKIEHKSYIASGSVHPPPFFQWKILGAHLGNMYGVFKADIRQERMEDTS